MTLEQNLKTVLGKIETAKNKSIWGQQVDLIAATKTQGISKVEDLYHLGVKTIGENRVQEAEGKFLPFPGFEKIKKRFIGHLQSNKVNKCLKLFDSIDSIDSLRLAKKLNNALYKSRNKIECLIEINTSGEPQKHGFQPQITKDIISCFELNQLNVVGLMTVGPNTRDETIKQSAFSLLRKLKDQINNELGFQVIIELSMGMTNDYELAIQEGSTMVRVGTGLFGNRKH
ncbi:MAG: YggS family pyridoxal phosphate-dependent enzyme [Candidatus Marinimicrobia bacterium]|nr:YggS family pyridoxal phosphate-dependent enzyme [Candidatus Neomarinimicrobiota bacterium]